MVRMQPSACSPSSESCCSWSRSLMRRTSLNLTIPWNYAGLAPPTEVPVLIGADSGTPRCSTRPTPRASVVMDQTILRHSDVKLTLQFYSHAVSQDRMAAAGEMLTAILSHAAGQSGLKAD